MNRSIDLTDYFDKGMDVVVEDLFFNAGGCPPKIYEQKKSDKDEKNKDESKSKDSSKKTLKVIFKLNHAETRWGQTVHIVGGSSGLGSWETKGAKKMSSVNTYPRWQNSIELTLDSKKDAAKVEYKYFIHDKKSSKLNWEKGINRCVDLSSYFDNGKAVVVEDMFFGAQGCSPEVYEASNEDILKAEKSKEKPKAKKEETEKNKDEKKEVKAEKDDKKEEKPKDEVKAVKSDEKKEVKNDDKKDEVKAEKKDEKVAEKKDEKKDEVKAEKKDEKKDEVKAEKKVEIKDEVKADKKDDKKDEEKAEKPKSGSDLDDLNKKIESLFKQVGVDTPAEKKSEDKPKTDTKTLNDLKAVKVDENEKKYKDLMNEAASFQPKESKKSKWGDLKNVISKK